MNKYIKWGGIVIGTVLLLAVLAVGVLYMMGRSILTKTYDVDIEMVVIPTDAATQARGQHLSESIATCSGCHEADLGGGEFLNDPTIGVIYASNLTAGSDGAGARYTDEDWVRAIAYGVAPDGRGLMVMPAHNFHQLSDEDLGAIIAYVKSMPPIESPTGAPELKFMAVVLSALGAFGELPVEQIDHSQPRPAAPAPGVTADYGAYLVTMGDCRGCHSANLAGGRPIPSDPWAPNLTPGGEMSGWNEADFLNLMRDGRKPSGAAISKKMPYEMYGKQSTEELQAMWMYLSGLEALEENPRP
jgi:mono/diheme cytochrome c family protein